jgi:linoleate 10R-lipoxygenase
MEFFLRPENATIWSQVQTLAQQNNETELHKYVKEAQRLTSPVKTVRAATKAEQLEGQSIQPGNVVVLMLGESGRTPVSGFEDADKFLPERADVVVDAFSYGPHECFGQHLALAFVTGLVKLVADLKKLRPAPGQMGEVKTIQVGFEKVFLNDSWSHLAHNASTWKVHFDGHGKGNFEGDREPTKRLDMQEYYYQIRKRKAELLE